MAFDNEVHDWLTARLTEAGDDLHHFDVSEAAAWVILNWAQISEKIGENSAGPAPEGD